MSRSACRNKFGIKKRIHCCFYLQIVMCTSRFDSFRNTKNLHHGACVGSVLIISSIQVEEIPLGLFINIQFEL